MRFSRQTTPPQAEYFLDWLDREVLTQERTQAAHRLFAEVIKHASPVERLRYTPQTPPYHAEGPMVANHVERMLAGVFAFQAGVTLSQVEEFIRERDFLLEFQDLERLLKEYVPFLSAYAVCHDVGKADTLILASRAGSRGSGEGFHPGERDTRPTTEAEVIRYDKLLRAHGDGMAFFDAYQIEAHYPGHARVSAGDMYATTREAVLDFFQLAPSHAKLLTELTRLHMDVILAFQRGPSADKYLAFGAIAERLGLNRSLFYDLLAACLFLDAVLGSLGYENGVHKADLELVLNLFKAEREAQPERHAAREESLRRGRKTALREALAEAGLAPEDVFELLQTPYGPARGRIMERVYALLRDPEAREDFGACTEEVRRRAEIVRKLLEERDLSV